MVKPKEKITLDNEFIILLIGACKVIIKANPNIRKNILSQIEKNHVFLIYEALKCYKNKQTDVLENYWGGHMPSLQTIRRSLNRVSPIENGCSLKLKEIYGKIISMDTRRISTTNVKPIGQGLFWGVNFGLEPGACINGANGEFIPWSKLQQELTLQVANSIPREITIPATLRLLDHFGKKNWIMAVIDKYGNHCADIWIGSDPEQGWKMDGKVRIGKTVSDEKWIVWQVYQRYSDGSYRVLRSV